MFFIYELTEDSGREIVRRGITYGENFVKAMENIEKDFDVHLVAINYLEPFVFDRTIDFKKNSIEEIKDMIEEY